MKILRHSSLDWNVAKTYLKYQRYTVQRLLRYPCSKDKSEKKTFFKIDFSCNIYDYNNYGLYQWIEKNITFQLIYSMLLYLRDSGSNQRKTKKALIDCCLS